MLAFDAAVVEAFIAELSLTRSNRRFSPTGVITFAHRRAGGSRMLVQQFRRGVRAALTVAALMWPAMAQAGPADRDPAFATSGIDVRAYGEGDATFSDVAVLPDGRVLAVGWLVQPPGGLQVLVARFTASGQPDGTFGTNGVRVHALDPECGSRARALTVLPDGRFVIAGAVEATPMRCTYTNRPFVARFLADGNLDTTFNGTGFTTIAGASGSGANLYDVAAQNDGSIVTSGVHGTSVIAARFTVTGLLDATYSPGAPAGIAQITPAGTTVTEAGPLAIDSSGRAVIGGSRLAASGRRLFALRLTTAGELDTAYAAGGSQPGVALTTVDGAIGGMVLNADERAVLAGATTSGDDIVLTRLMASGAVDDFFSGDRLSPGVESTSVPEGPVDVRDLELAPDGDLVVSGQVSPSSGEQLLMARYTGGGPPDTTFNPAGTPSNVKVDPVDGHPDWDATAIAFTPSEKLVAAGHGSQDRAFVARYGSDTSPPVPVITASWPRPSGASGDKPLRPGQTVTFDSSGSTDGDGLITERTWAAADGDFTTSGTTFETVAGHGEARARLRLRDDDGNEVIGLRAEPTAANRGPVASIIAVDSVPVNVKAVLDGSQSGDSDGVVREYQWDLNGDGKTEVRSPDDEISQTFRTVGKHTVGLVVVDDEHGASAMATKTIDVRAPGFTLKRLVPSSDYAPLAIGPGGTETAQILVKRGTGSVGDLTVTTTQPKQLKVVADPAVLGSAAEQTLKIHITPDTPLAPGKANVVVAVRSSIAEGEEIETVVIPVEVLPTHDAAIQGIEVTQGTQDDLGRCHLFAYIHFKALPDGHNDLSDERCSTLPSLPVGKQFGAVGFAADYQGVPLIWGKQTVVRVFAAMRRDNGLKGDERREYTALLTGKRGSKVLGTIQPVSRPKNLDGDTDLFVTHDERGREERGLFFVLPPSWTKGRPIDLRAELRVSENAATAPKECGSDLCKADDRFTLKKVEFINPGGLAIGMVRLYETNEHKDPAFKADADFSDGLGIQSPPPANVALPQKVWPSVGDLVTLSMVQLPLPDGMLSVPASYMAAFNWSDIANDTSLIGKDKLYKSRTRLQNKIDEGELCWAVCPAEIIGIASATLSDKRGVSSGDFYGDIPASISYRQSPMTVLHELIHGWNLKHSHGENCLGDTEDQEGDAIDANGYGHFQGVKLDPRGWLPGRSPATPFIVKSPDAGSPVDSGLFDVMSYCGNGDSEHWVAPAMWRRLLNQRLFRAGPSSTLERRRATSRSAHAGSGDVLGVYGVAGKDGVKIFTVARREAKLLSGETDPTYVLRALAGGEVLAEAAMEAKALGHGGETSLAGEVDATSAEAVVIVRNGQEVARMEASPAAPTVTLRSPGAGTVVRGGPLRVAWKASDADGTKPLATVAYSADGGKLWRAVAETTESSVVVPRAQLAPGSRALIRVTVSDGFRETEVLSRPFRVLRQRPRPVIVLPRAGDEGRVGAPVFLAGNATEDGGAEVPAGRLRWYAGKRLVGRGPQAAASGLKPGRVQIRLVATDSRGLTGTARAVVRIAGAAPLLTTIKAPKRISRTARSVTLRLAASYPAPLRVAGRRLRLGSRQQSVRVPVKPGRKPLAITLRLGSGKLVSTEKVTIARR